jgi:predicted deacylase
MARGAFRIGGEEVPPGEARTLDVPLSRLADHTRMRLRVKVVHGRKDGPVLFVSAAIHGDEVLGCEVIRRLIASKSLRNPRGTIVYVPVVNAYGFVSNSRYLPDRRDLNRCFPGTKDGSLASQLAHTFMREVVARSDVGIDLHTGAIHRANLPQIRANLDDPETARLAEAFGAPVTVAARLRDGSLREAAGEKKTPVLLYEAGEALRYDAPSVSIGVRGVVRVMAAMGMVPARKVGTPATIRVGRSAWVRCPSGGLLRLFKRLGDMAAEGEVVGVVSDPFGEHEDTVVAPFEGIVIGRLNLPVVNKGDAALHLARIGEEHHDPAETVRDHFDGPDPLFDTPL